MIAAAPSGAGGYAQSGFYDHPGGGTAPYVFAEYLQNNSFTFKRNFYGSTVKGEVHTYKAAFAGSHINLCKDSTILETTPFNPYVTWRNGHPNDSQFTAEWFGELYHQPTDIPGDSANPTTFQNLQVQKISDDGWTNNPGNNTRRSNDVGAGRYFVSGSLLDTNGKKSFKIYTVNP